ncbi:hypothetical protein Patl1_36756 [Pistacia atlantica]|nr:hypothetical protein Patl1_36756 [Pistacia atlantica]
MDDFSILIYDIKFAKIKNKLINHQQKVKISLLDHKSCEGKILACPADIWSFGYVVIDMLSGKPGWEYVTKEELFEHIGYTSELPSLLRNVSENVRDLLSKCLIKDFEDRWTAEELLQHPFLSVDA